MFFIFLIGLFLSITNASTSKSESFMTEYDVKKTNMLTNLQLSLDIPQEPLLPESTLLFLVIQMADDITDGQFSQVFGVENWKYLRVVMFDYFYQVSSPHSLRLALAEFFKCKNELQMLEKAIYFVADYRPIVPHLLQIRHRFSQSENPFLTAINCVRLYNDDVYHKCLRVKELGNKSRYSLYDIQEYTKCQQEPWCYIRALEMFFEGTEWAVSLESIMRRTVSIIQLSRVGL